VLSGNERLVAAEVIRQILLMRYSDHVRDAVIRQLNATERPIAGMLRDALALDAGLRDPLQVVRLNILIDQVNRLRATAWVAAADTVTVELSSLAQAEAEDERDLLAAWFPSLNLSAAGMGVAALALAAPFHGRDTRGWVDSVRASEAQRITRVVYAGVAAGQGPAAVARLVVGTRALRGRDGATQTSRNHLDTVVRTAVMHVAGRAKDALRAANAQLLTSEQYVAVLDDRTTSTCRNLNGRRFRVGVGPVPPLHMNCRSSRVLVLPEDIGGPVWEPEVYDAWLRRQPQAVRVELMGAARAARSQTVDEGSFTDYGARPMSLRQIRVLAARLTGSYSR
jgi:SPP1 gp7 family putative phage head morphogenesis protein